ncbi:MULTISPECIES: aminotransferase class I/II-fold pyridoxal phosphate-dependent enzyme [unclassified Leucobacter]|uniref:aminotransferase class I/II-fold pyridoxal phosphate-dependent enzyme n=1 Tax=unclassified Leucobacter TaxID=2621730 RepID=UPI00203C2813|nr:MULTISPECIES: amino acid decarboxylase [unclassified Leucobacter]
MTANTSMDEQTTLALSPRATLDSWRPGAGPVPERHLRAPYADALARHASSAPLHLMVPGHGCVTDEMSALLHDFVGERAALRDIPPMIDGIDMAGDEPLAEASHLAAEAWGAKRAWFLSNGASQANRTAAIAVRGLGDRILAQRSAHSSFSDGILAAGLTPSFVLPTVDGVHGISHNVSPEMLAEALNTAALAGETPAAVYVVSPSYFGSVADVRGLADVAHSHDIPLIVDGAWGPHFGFHEALPESPARLGADLVVSSTHKLAGSLTQSALLLLGHGAYADALEPLIERAFTMTSSTSASSLLRGSIDVARLALVTGHARIGASIEVAERFRALLRADDRFGVVSDHFLELSDTVEVDPLRVPIDLSAAGVSGHWMRDRLIAQHDIYFEMATATTLVAVIGAGKTPDVARVLSALDVVVDSPAAAAERLRHAADVAFPPLPAPGALRMLPRDAFFAATDLVPAALAIGRVSADTLAAYPPGIPNLMPGEEITAEAVAFLTAVAASPSGYVRGAVDPEVSKLRVVRA